MAWLKQLFQQQQAAGFSAGRRYLPGRRLPRLAVAVPTKRVEVEALLRTFNIAFDPKAKVRDLSKKIPVDENGKVDTSRVPTPTTVQRAEMMLEEQLEDAHKQAELEEPLPPSPPVALLPPPHGQQDGANALARRSRIPNKFFDEK